MEGGGGGGGEAFLKLVTFHLTHVGQNPMLAGGTGAHSDDVMVKLRAECVWWSWHYSQRTRAPSVLVKTSALAQMAVFVLSKKTQPGNGLWGHNFSFLLTGPISG